MQLSRKMNSTPQMTQVRKTEALRVETSTAHPNIAVVGLGEAGCNIVSWIKSAGSSSGKLIAADTDAARLNLIRADKRILIVEKLSDGQAYYGADEKGDRVDAESIRELIGEAKGSGITFICASLGGNVGTSVSTVLARELKRAGRLVIAVVTIPFPIEKYAYAKAKKGLEKLREACDTVVAIDSTKLFKIAGSRTLHEALGVANEYLGLFVKGITEISTSTALKCIDLDDLRWVTEDKGLAAIGFGQVEKDGRIEGAVRSAIEGLLLDIRDVTNSKGVLVHVSGGSSLTLQEVSKAAELVTKLLPPSVKTVCGASIDDTIDGHARVMVMLTGVDTPFFKYTGVRLSLWPIRLRTGI